MQVQELLKRARQILLTTEAQLESELLLMHCLQCTKTWLFINNTMELSEPVISNYWELINRRLNGEPIAYILGKKGFWTLDLMVNSHTLIPRPETELLVETILQYAKENSSILDLGTGSGAIALALASEIPSAQIIATDFSNDALLMAKKNAQLNGIDNVKFYCGEWFNALVELESPLFDIIVSNPPYIEENDVHLTQGDLRFEPITALASGADGLQDISQIVRHAPRYLKQNGKLLVEHGWLQAEPIQQLFAQAGFSEIATLNDLEQRPRLTQGTWLHR